MLSCTKKYETKNYLAGEWKLEKISYTNSEGFEYKYIPEGTIVFLKIDGTTFGFELKVDYPNDSIDSFFDSGILNFNANFKGYKLTKNGKERYSSIPLLTKDELMFNFSAENFFCKIVASK